MGKMSRDKGQRGEREVRDLLRIYGHWAERGQQRAGGPDSPDVKHSIEGVYIEVKFREKFSLYEALAQAENDAGEKDIPVIFHRRKRKPWVVSMEADHFMGLIQMLYRKGQLS